MSMVLACVFCMGAIIFWVHSLDLHFALLQYCNRREVKLTSDKTTPDSRHTKGMEIVKIRSINVAHFPMSDRLPELKNITIETTTGDRRSIWEYATNVRWEKSKQF